MSLNGLFRVLRSVVIGIGLVLSVSAASLTVPASGNSIAEFFTTDYLEFFCGAPISTQTATAMALATSTPIAVVTVVLPDVTATPGPITIPITVSDLTGLNVISYDLQITFDPAVVQPALVPFDTSGTLSQTMLISPNASNAGHLIIGAFQATSLIGSGTLIKLNFNVVGTPGQLAALTFEDYTDPFTLFHPAFLFNDGDPATATTNGSVTIPAPTATNTATATATNTATDTPTSTATETFTPTATSTATDTPTPTATETFTPTATNTATDTPTPTATETFTPTATNTATDTPTSTPTPAETPSISGTITYGNAIGNPMAPRFVKNVSLSSTAGSPALGPVITGTPGTYILTGFGVGAYTIKPTKPGGSNGAITSNDAARVAQGVVSSPGFVSQNQRFAADVSGNGNVTSNDAALIARFAAGLTGAGNAGQWKFFVTGAPSPLPTAPQTYDDSRSYATVTSPLTGEDYVAVLVGEVSGNWNPATHPRPVSSRRLAVGSGLERSVDLKLPQIVTVADKDVIIPVNVQGAADKGIISYEFDLKYDPGVIQPLENPVDVTGTVSRGLRVVANPHEPGLLRVVIYGAMPIDEDGVLLNLRFTPIGAPGSVSPLMWERIMFNEGEPRVTATDGQVKLF